MSDLVSKVINDDFIYILSNRNKIIEQLSKKNNLNKKIAILGGTSTQEISSFLELFLLDKGIKTNIYQGAYHQYYEESIFDNPALDKFNPDIIYIFLSFFDINPFPKINDTKTQVEEKFIKITSKIEEVIQSLKKKYQSQIIITNIPLPPYRSLGNLEQLVFYGKVNFVNRINQFIATLYDRENILIQDIEYLSSYMGLDSFYDLQQWNLFKFAQSQKATMQIAFNLSGLIASLYGKQKKLLITDLDNTLWGGVVGDDGVDKIKIGFDTPQGEIFALYQQYLKELYDRGIMLAVCSKNEKNIALEGLERDGNILNKNHFTAFIANWENKDINIKNIIEQISIGEDSAVFIDDNPVERTLVNNSLPLISVVEENNVYKFIRYLDKSCFFEPINISLDDLNRNKMYKDNYNRKQESIKFKNYEEYLDSLETELTIGIISSRQEERCCQLINKTNQFNLTNIRLNNSDFNKIVNSEEYLCLYGQVKDKFGDSGIVYVLICKKEGSFLHIKINLMSCRVLKRNIEFAMLDAIVNYSKKEGINFIIGQYVPTERNLLVKDYYSKSGFNIQKDSDQEKLFIIKVEDYLYKNNHLKVNSFL